MTSAATESQATVARINRLIADLAKANLAVFGIAYDYLHFGNWTIEVGQRHHRVLLQWDGKESVPTASTASVRDAQAQKEWELVAEESWLPATTLVKRSLNWPRSLLSKPLPPNKSPGFVTQQEERCASRDSEIQRATGT